MIERNKEALNQLSKEQLIYLIEQLDHSQFLIGEICVEVSKYHIDSDKAINKIRNYIYHIPSMYNITGLKAYINMKMGKISESEYRKTIGLED